jgi:CheY-like chemotaxis protein
MEISESRLQLDSLGIRRSLSVLKRLFLLAPFRIVFSIALVFVAVVLYHVFAVFQTNIPFYIAVLLLLFTTLVWGFEYYLGDIDQSDTRKGKSLQYQEFCIKPSHTPYTHEEISDLLKTLSAHQNAVFRENPVVFEKFKTESEHRLILMVYDVEPAGELLKTAFHHFGFSVVLLTSPEADHDFVYQSRADLVVWDADLKRYEVIFKAVREQQALGNARVLTASAITRRPDVLKNTFEMWLSRYPQTFADAFFWHLFQAASAIPKVKASSVSVGGTIHDKSS